MKRGVEMLKLLKLGFPKKTTTVIFGWTHGSDTQTLGENALDESKRGGDKTPRVWIAEVDIDHLWRTKCGTLSATPRLPPSH
jgi:hypothetical protein